MDKDAQGTPVESGTGRDRRALNTRLVRTNVPAEAEHLTIELRVVNTVPTMFVTVDGLGSHTVTIARAEGQKLEVHAHDPGGSRQVILRDPTDVFAALRFAGRWLRTEAQGQD